jgi:predicted DNA-binding protein with PD1-like motif
MRSKLLHELQGVKTFMLAFSTGDHVTDEILAFAARQKIGAAYLSGVGGLREVTLAYFDWTTKEYKPIPIREQVELVSFIGNLSMAEGKPKLHAHVVIGRADGSAMGGHLLDAVVRPTLELVLVESPVTLVRVQDEESRLPLLDLSK